jgi:cytochrome c oxidase cbb3-type subunit 4
MTYDNISYIVQTWGLVYFAVLFGAVLVYALWPRNRRKFRDAANIPFKED